MEVRPFLLIYASLLDADNDLIEGPLPIALKELARRLGPVALQANQTDIAAWCASTTPRAHAQFSRASTGLSLQRETHLFSCVLHVVIA